VVIELGVGRVLRVIIVGKTRQPAVVYLRPVAARVVVGVAVGDVIARQSGVASVGVVLAVVVVGQTN
jgi:hypothetical protein